MRSPMIWGAASWALCACGGGGAGESGPASTPDAEADAMVDAAPAPLPDADYRPELTWIALPARSFTMGSAKGEANEAPAHTVAVPAFEMTATEVTVAQYRGCVQARVCSRPDTGGACNYGDPVRQDHPVNCVDWNQAQAYADWLGGGVRLPTEAEWEYAATGGGRDRDFPWGDEPATCERAVMAETTPGCGDGTTAPVCSRPAGNSPQGLCDLAGNVWEWVEDWYHEDYAGAPRDGSAFVAEPGAHRVLRGGGWAYDAANQRARRRGVVIEQGRDANVGFRLVR